jgi:DNA-binding NarL/FixJ family response regulator
MGYGVSIVDDEECVLAILGNGFDLGEGFSCVGRHLTAADALKTIPKIKPDVVLMDIRMPEMSGIECTQRLKAVLPKTHFVMLTGMVDAYFLFQSLMAGASGYLVKPVTVAQCKQAVIEVMEGGAPLSKQVARMLVQSFSKSFGPGNQTGVHSKHLSAREREVMACLFQGASDKEIAGTLGIGTGTVHSHMHSIFEKLGVTTRRGRVGLDCDGCRLDQFRNLPRAVCQARAMGRRGSRR